MRRLWIISALLLGLGIAHGQQINGGSGGGGSPTGAAGGGLAGTYPDPTVASVPATAMPALTGDCTTSAGAVATTCTKTNGTAFGGYATISAGALTNSLAANVPLNNIGTFFDGPSVAQGSTGTWFIGGIVTLVDTAGAATFYCQLWDGTTAIASGEGNSRLANLTTTVSMTGIITSPTGNLRISCKDVTTTSGLMLSNSTGINRDSTISAFRIN